MFEQIVRLFCLLEPARHDARVNLNRRLQHHPPRPGQWYRAFPREIRRETLPIPSVSLLISVVPLFSPVVGRGSVRHDEIKRFDGLTRRRRRTDRAESIERRARCTPRRILVASRSKNRRAAQFRECFDRPFLGRRPFRSCTADRYAPRQVSASVRRTLSAMTPAADFKGGETTVMV